MISRTILFLVAAWLAVSITVKLARYLPERETAVARAERIVSALLAQEGWQAGARISLTKAAVYQAHLFVKPGCPRPIAIVVLGSSDEAESLISQRLGSNVAYIGAAGASAHQDIPAFVGRALMAGSTFRHALPTIAVSPAPTIEPHPCAPPVQAAWTALER